MRKLLLVTLVTSLIGIILFIGCQKNKNAASGHNPETSIQLVPESEARTIATNFNPAVFFDASNPSNHSPYKSILTGNNQIKNFYTIKDSYGSPAIYIYNYANDQGFLLVSADYQLRPVLAFVERGAYKEDTVPPGLVQWGVRIIKDIEAVRLGWYDNTKVAKAVWRQYKLTGNQGISAARPSNADPDDPCTPPTSVTVGPLLPVTWGQTCTYNDLVENKSCTDACFYSPNAFTGCVATSTAQIIRYWHPANANYSYDYANMPATSGNADVQRLMRDIGTEVGMTYNCGAAGGSSASGGNVPGMLSNVFKLGSPSRSDYGGYSYADVQNNLYYHQPVLLEGCTDQTTQWLFWHIPAGACHEWVCDGYSEYNYVICDNGNYGGGGSLLSFHMNWGWHEVYGGDDYNGWFAFNNWNITRADGTNLNFRYFDKLVTNIHP